ncbi:chromatin modification protein [Martiniozyma asiatica (nom. inval.)]|nr:chromatin modification protein [Martiniozyma asiatica]
MSMDISRLVLEYLNKKGFSQTEAMLRLEQSKLPTASAPSTPTSANHSRAYVLLRSWIEESLEMYKYELEKFLYPVFVHCYISLIKQNQIGDARLFFDKFKIDHSIHHTELITLSTLNDINQPLAQMYLNNKYKILVSQTTMNLLLGFLNENQSTGGDIIIRILNNHFEIDTQLEITNKDQIGEQLEGIPAIYELIKTGKENDNEKFKTTLQEFKNKNEQPLKLGAYPQDAEFQKEVEAELKIKDEKMSTGTGSGSESKLMDEYQKNFKIETDDTSPLKDILPLPQKTALDVKRKIQLINDSRLKIISKEQPKPSICMYTFHNATNLNCLSFNSTCTIIATGQDSFVKLYSIDGTPLNSIIKSDLSNSNQSTNLNGLPLNTTRTLIGHSAPVYSVSFSPCGHYLISGSSDGTIRLWSMDTFTQLVTYRGHNSPIWDVKFSPFGHYFVSAGHDQTARLWSCDHIYPLRIFAGHLNDVDCVEFHPNSCYIFTGSSDKTIRMWDISNGETVRVFIGHNSPVCNLSVHPNGQQLLSSSEDGVIIIWDIASGRKIKSGKGGKIVTWFEGEVVTAGNVVKVGDDAWAVKGDIRGLAKSGRGLLVVGGVYNGE